MESDVPQVDLSTLPVEESTNVELDSQAQDFVDNLNKLQKEVQANKSTNETNPVKSHASRVNRHKPIRELDTKLATAVADDGLLADHREERRKLAERLENDPEFRRQYTEDLAAKNLAARSEDNILDEADINILGSELTEEDIAAMADDLEEVGTGRSAKKDEIDLATALKGMRLVFQNVNTVNIYMCDHQHSSK